MNYKSILGTVRVSCEFLFRQMLTVCFLGSLIGLPLVSALAADKESTPERAASELQKNLTLELGNGVKLELVLIQPGTFMMGADNMSDNEKPAHKVTLTKPFYMGKFEVTQEQWNQVVGENPSNFKGGADSARQPVEMVSWNDINSKFLPKIAELVPKGMKARLPTEAEWEYCCRAGTTGDYAGELDDMAWYSENSDDRPHPVGRKKPNAWGLYDMHGNVWEWCADLKEDYSPDAVTDPAGASSSKFRIGRGGAWCVGDNYSKSAFRDWGIPDFKSPRLGFRLAVEANP